MASWRITTWVVWEKPPKGHKHVTFVTCMYGHHYDKCLKLRYLKKTSWGGGGGGGGINNSLEREKKNNKRKSRRNKSSGWRNKKKVVHKVLWCSNGRSSVTRELKLVYSTRATSRYQEWEDSLLHAPRGRGFSYSGSFAFKGRVVVSCPKGNVWLQI